MTILLDDSDDSDDTNQGASLSMLLEHILPKTEGHILPHGLRLLFGHPSGLSTASTASFASAIHGRRFSRIGGAGVMVALLSLARASRFGTFAANHSVLFRSSLAARTYRCR